MSLKVITTCPICNKTQEATGERLGAIDLLTTEGWVIECRWCRHVYLHSISDKFNDEKDKEPQLEMTKYHEDVEQTDAQLGAEYWKRGL